MLDYIPCSAKTATELDAKLREIFALDNVGRGDEISGTLYIDYSDESVKLATLVPTLESRGVAIVWRKS